MLVFDDETKYNGMQILDGDADVARESGIFTEIEEVRHLIGCRVVSFIGILRDLDEFIGGFEGSGVCFKAYFE